MTRPQPLAVIIAALERLRWPAGYGAIYLIAWPCGTYVGQTRQQITRRWAQHAEDLRRGRHVNDAMLAAWQADPLSLYATILEVCRVERLDERERWWIERYGSANEAR